MLLLALLFQHFYYFASGEQADVYHSKDRTHVLKLIKPEVEKRLSLKSQALSVFKKRDFSSYEIAYEMFQKETGVEMIHFGKSKNLPKKQWLLDSKAQIRYINLNKLPFLIQKQAENFEETVKELLKKGHEEEALVLIEKTAKIMRTLSTKGFALHDPSVLKNWGVVDGEPIILDVGQFTNANEKRCEKMYYKGFLTLFDRLLEENCDFVKKACTRVERVRLLGDPPHESRPLQRDRPPWGESLLKGALSCQSAK